MKTAHKKVLVAIVAASILSVYAIASLPGAVSTSNLKIAYFTSSFYTVAPITTLTIAFDCTGPSGVVNISVSVDGGTPQYANNYQITTGYHYVDNFNFLNLSGTSHVASVKITDASNGAVIFSQ